MFEWPAVKRIKRKWVGRVVDELKRYAAFRFLLSVAAESRRDHLTLLAAGVAFYFLLAFFPALIATVSTYGLFVDAAAVEEQITSLAEALPPAATELIGQRLRRLEGTSDGTLGVGLLLSVAGAFWTASRGANALVEALDLAYNRERRRAYWKARGVALALTLAFTGTLIVTLLVLTALPKLVAASGFIEAETTVAWARWPVLGIVATVSFNAVYRYVPSRRHPGPHLLGAGGIVAAGIWLAASAGLATFAGEFFRLDETYGALASPVVLMLWLYSTAFAVLLGAEVEAELWTAKQKSSPEQVATDGEESERAGNARDTSA